MDGPYHQRVKPAPSSGAARAKPAKEAIDFFMAFRQRPRRHICIENPVGVMSTIWQKPTQIIQP